MKKYNNLFGYAGCKISMIKYIVNDDILPENGKVLIEPFCGSCAFLLNTNYDRYYINDSNIYIINFIKAIYTLNLDDIEKEYYLFRDKVKNCKQEEWCLNYRKYRDEFLNNYEKLSLLEKASHFLFLLNFSFGSKGFQYGTGKILFTGNYSFRKDIYEKIKLKNIYIYNLDYKEFIKQVLKIEKQEDCILYLDPPYIDSFKYNKDNILDNFPLEIKYYFDNYNFNKVIMSNFKNDLIMDLYKNFNIKEVLRRIEINSKNKQYKIELIIYK